jgi:hypothetical protein
MYQSNFLFKAFALAGLVVAILIAFLSFQKPESSTDSTPTTLAQLQSSSQTSKISSQTSSSNSNTSKTNISSNTPIFNSMLPREKYTNFYYPGLEISYPNDWKIEKINAPSTYNDLLDGGIKLKKGNQTFTLSVRPLATGELQKSKLSDQKLPILEENNVTNQFKKIVRSDKGFVYLPRLVSQVQENQEEFMIMTNIGVYYIKQTNPDKIPELNKLYSDKYFTIHYLLRMEYEGDKETFAEADEIVRNSRFIFSPLDSVLWKKEEPKKDQNEQLKEQIKPEEKKQDQKENQNQ